MFEALRTARGIFRSLRIYYGGADTVFCMATAKISELIDFAKNR